MGHKELLRLRNQIFLKVNCQKKAGGSSGVLALKLDW